MKLLIIGGEKVSNIEEPLTARYQSGVVKIDTLKFLDELHDYIVSGKSFDRLIIIENTFAKHTRTVAQSVLRELMIDLANVLHTISEPFDIIFVIKTPEFGLTIEEEMMQYREHLKIVQLQGGYTVKLFEELCMKDLREIRSHFGLVKVTDLVDNSVAPTSDTHEIEDIHITEPIINDKTIYEDLEGVTPQESSLLYDEDETHMGSYVPNFAETELALNLENPPIEEVQEETSPKIEDIYIPKAHEQEESIDDTSIITPTLNPFEQNLYNESTDLSIQTPQSNMPQQVHDEDAPQINPMSQDAPQQQEEKPTAPTKNKESFFNLGKKKIGKALKKHLAAPNQQSIPQQQQQPQTYPDSTTNVFDQDLYNTNEDDSMQKSKLSNKEFKQLQTMLGKLSDRRATYIFTGTPNSGTSTMAYGIAELLSRQGYNVLLVDCDTHNRAMSYITKDLYTMVHNTSESSSNLFAAIGSPLTTTAVTHIVSQGFHVLTMGLDQDTKPLNQVIDPIKFQRFTGIAREHYHFIIYDMPYDILMTLGVEIAFISDGIIMTTESNTNGLIKLMNYLANIENPEVRALMFTKVRVLLNKYVKGTSYFGKKTQKQRDIFRQLDCIVEDLTGMEAEYRFVDLTVLSCVNYNTKLTNQWFTDFTPCKDSEIENTLINILNNMVTL